MHCLPDHPCSHQPYHHYLLQRIQGFGKLHRHSCPYVLPLDAIPCGMQGPFRLQQVRTEGNPIWQEVPCHRRGTLRLQVRIPLVLFLCDSCGKQFQASSYLDEELLIHLECPETEAWRSRLVVNSCVRLACRCARCNSCQCDAQLEVWLEGYLIMDCATGSACSVPCTDQRPWYPEPGYRCR